MHTTPCAAPNMALPQAARPELSDLPDLAKEEILGYLDWRQAGALLVDHRWTHAMSTAAFDRLALAMLKHHEDAPIGSWPALHDWQGVAAAANANATRGGRYARLLANVWSASERLSSGGISLDQAEIAAPIRSVRLDGIRAIRMPDGARAFMATVVDDRWASNPLLRMLSLDGQWHSPAGLEGWCFQRNQSPGYCDVTDATPLDRPAGPWVIHDPDYTQCRLYDPATDTTAPLPTAFAEDDVLVATSADGRFVVAEDDSARPRLLLHDRANGTTQGLEIPNDSCGRPLLPHQLSVDSDGNVFAAASSHGIQFLPSGMQQEALPERYSNYRLSTNERYLLTSRADGRDLHLMDRLGGTCMTLRHCPGFEGEVLALAFSPAMAWAATTTTEGCLSVYSLIGAQHQDTLAPSLSMRLPLSPGATRVRSATTWCDDDGSAVNVAWTEVATGIPEGNAIRRLRLPLV